MILIGGMDNLAFRVLTQQLQKNSNTQAYKQVIRDRAQRVEKVAYWYYTSQQDQYLRNIWENEVKQNSLVKKRLTQITDEAFREVEFEIAIGKLVQPSEDQHVQMIGNISLIELGKSHAHQTAYFSSEHPKTREAQQRLKLINEEQEKFREKIAKRQKHSQQRRLQKQHLQTQIRQKIQEQKRQHYRQDIKKHIQQQKRQQQQRKQQNKKFERFLKQYKSSKPLHVLMQEQYKTKVQLPFIQQRKRKLEQHPKQHIKPSLEELNKHDQEYMNYKLSKPEKTFISHQTIDVGYKSRFYLQESRKLHGDDSEEEETIMDIYEKKKRYSQFVKEKFKPKIMVPTEKPPQEESDNGNRTARRRRDVALEAPDRSRVIEVGNGYLEYMKGLQKKRNLHSSQSQATNIQPKAPRYVNYLEDLKYAHRSLHKGTGANWQVDLRDKTASSFERRDRVLMKSKQLQERAFRKEQFLNLSSQAKPAEVMKKKKEIDDTLIESIRAKVAVLKESIEQQ